MQTYQGNVLTRDDTFFGVCEAIGEDFGFNPNWLRLAFGVSLLLNPPAVVGAYVAAGALVLVSRLIVPNPRLPAPAQAPAVAVEPASAETGAEAKAEALPLAA